MKHIKIDENYYLLTQVLEENVTMVEKNKSVNHIIAIDVSGSMYYELAQIRKNLKNKISNMVKPEDTISIIWFSGNNEAGILKEEVVVTSLKQLNDLNEAIDRWLKPIGMTAFAKPLELASEIIERVKSKKNDSVFSLVFMSDGYNNNVSWESVVKALNNISTNLSYSTIVEYGNYADSKKLTEMASILGGEKINCDNFEDYDIVLNHTFNKNISSGKKIVVEVKDKHLYDFAFSISDGSVLLHSIVDGKFMVNPDTKEVHYFSTVIGGEEDCHQHTALYAAIYVLADKLQNDDAEKLFYMLGDNYHYKMLANAFGKQKLNAFKSAIKDCVSDVNKRFPEGLKKIEKLDDNTYCLMNLIEDLGELPNCLFYPNHNEFNYNRIGRKRVAKGTVLSDDDKKRLSNATNVEDATEVLNELKERNVDLKFIYSNPEAGYPLTDLIWNEGRANLSVRIFIDGSVKLPENKFLINEISTFRYNTFTLIKDGILNVDKLPVSYSDELIKLLAEGNVKYEIWRSPVPVLPVDAFKIIIDLSSLPIINKSMVKSISANELAKQEWELIKLQGNKKVYDYYKKELFPRESKSFIESVGKDGADWLKTIGITDYNGFAPKSDFEESTDFYMSVNLITKIKGLSSLPKVNDVVEKIKNNKPLKLNEWVMADAIKRFTEYQLTESYISLSETQKLGMLETYLRTKSELLNKKKRKIMQSIAQIKFALILSKKNFIEFKTFDDNKLTITLDGQELQFTFEFSEKEVKI